MVDRISYSKLKCLYLCTIGYLECLLINGIHKHMQAIQEVHINEHSHIHYRQKSGVASWAGHASHERFNHTSNANPATCLGLLLQALGFLLLLKLLLLLLLLLLLVLRILRAIGVTCIIRSCWRLRLLLLLLGWGRGASKAAGTLCCCLLKNAVKFLLVFLRQRLPEFLWHTYFPREKQSEQMLIGAWNWEHGLSQGTSLCVEGDDGRKRGWCSAVVHKHSLHYFMPWCVLTGRPQAYTLPANRARSLAVCSLCMQACKNEADGPTPQYAWIRHI